ncbi:hypothetical protein Trydic_g6035 [Trypoxylus dichotomus]
MSEILDGSCTIFTACNFFVKVFRYTYCNDRLRKILDSVEDDVFQPKDEESEKLLFKAMDDWRVVFRFYLVVCVTGISLWGVGAIFSDDDMALPFGYWYPFDVKRNPTYEIVFAYEVLGLLLMSIPHLTMDSMIVSFMVFLTGHLDVLNESLRGLNGSDHIDHETALREQVRCIVLYQKIKR